MGTVLCCLRTTLKRSKQKTVKLTVQRTMNVTRAIEKYCKRNSSFNLLNEPQDPFALSYNLDYCALQLQSHRNLF